MMRDQPPLMILQFSTSHMKWLLGEPIVCELHIQASHQNGMGLHESKCILYSWPVHHSQVECIHVKTWGA